MRSAIREHYEFFRQFRQRFETTGAVLPSSRFLAKTMTRPLRRRSRPSRILEVGPGTGAVTREIVAAMSPGDTLDLVEINEDLAGLLRHRFASDPSYRHAAPQSRVHVCPLQEFLAEERYDFIISGLPFNNFPSCLVQELLEVCLDLLTPGGTMSFFEYMYVRSLKRRIARPAERQRLHEIEQFLQSRFTDLRERRDWVFVNVPPAWVQHLRRPVG